MRSLFATSSRLAGRQSSLTGATSRATSAQQAFAVYSHVASARFARNAAGSSMMTTNQQFAQYSRPASTLANSLDTFARRHNSQPEIEGEQHKSAIQEMLSIVGAKSLDDLTSQIVPKSIYNPSILDDLDKQFTFKQREGKADGESDILQELKQHYAQKNKVLKSMIGMGYYDTITPPVILRNVLENPGWYTPYTPYQAEISQGRLESLLNYQTMITDLTGLDISNASLLDEGTAAGEAATMCLGVLLNNNKSIAKENKRVQFVVSSNTHPQTIDIIRTRCEPLNIAVTVVDANKLESFDYADKNMPVSGLLVQYPGSDGAVADLSNLVKKVHDAGSLVVFATDLLALCSLKSPGEMGADIAVGSNQRFGIPMGYGGPHAGFLATKEQYKRQMPGRLIGVSKDSAGNKAYRMALQTREQHIRRDKATSNICTAQALLSNISAFYAIYHGPEGLRKISANVHEKACTLAKALKQGGLSVFGGANTLFFDTIRVDLDSANKANEVMKRAVELGYNLRRVNDKSIGVSVSEATTLEDLQNVAKAFGLNTSVDALSVDNLIANSPLSRKSAYLTHEIFNSFHTEHELLRYIFRLQGRDISLVHSMIPLGSCTMKLNATAEMIPVTWPEMGNIHPFAPVEQAQGYQQMFRDLEKWLSKITGFDAVSLQPNSGAQGEYAGLMVIRKYFINKGQPNRNVCLIPVSAHGTNPASAAMAAMKVVVVKCDKNGNIDLDDLKQKAEQYRDTLACAMVTYPSTHGVFEESIRDLCNIVHENGGQVYMDGANMNAQVGLTAPGYIGADVCHLNLHKTFCIPHGGGGPGMGPIGVKSHLAPFLPSHSVVSSNSNPNAISAISAAPWGSSSILPISWMYIRMMGGKGLKLATQMAILNANYMAKKLEQHYKIYYRGNNDLVAHEFILDLAPFKKSAGIEAEDVAKRLMDFGFHAPTMSFPIAGTLMIEPTESESKAELDRYIHALITIREEIREIEEGKADRNNNVLKHAPHTAEVVTSDKWDRPYSRQKAGYPAPWLYNQKIWPRVGRIDSSYGDLNLICSCPPLSDYEK